MTSLCSANTLAEFIMSLQNLWRHFAGQARAKSGKLCHTQNCSLVEWKFCKDCNRFFKSDECFNRHKDDAGPAKSLCCALVKCKKYQRVVTRASLRDHHCGKVRCSTCQKYVKPENHQCYLQPVKTKKTRSPEEGSEFLDDDVAVENDVENTKNLMFFDFKCTQDASPISA